MTTDVTAAQFVDALLTRRTRDDGGSLGIRMGTIFGLAKEYAGMDPEQIELLLDSPISEARIGGVSIMDKQARAKRTSAERRKELFDLYLRRIDRIDSWDLVDLGCQHVIGGYLFDYGDSRELLWELARSRNPWERRTAIVSTLYFVRKGDVDDTFAIAEILRDDEEHFVQTATGGLLREAGKKDPEQHRRFLDEHAARMPRIALRFAIERLDEERRAHYRGLR